MPDYFRFLFKEEVKEMDPKEGKKIMEVITSYERKGREEGMEKGREEGREKGRKEGREEGIIQVAKRMLAKGKQVDEVAELTTLSIIDVEQLKVEMTKD